MGGVESCPLVSHERLACSSFGEPPSCLVIVTATKTDYKSQKGTGSVFVNPCGVYVDRATYEHFSAFPL